MGDNSERTGTTLGRPRSVEVDTRVLGAAVELFGTHGWSNVSIDAIARRSGVSKRSIYLRWPHKDALLEDALTSRLRVVDDIDTGDLRGDLRELARQMVSLYTGDTGPAALRLSLEAGPETAGLREQLRTSQIRAAKALVRRAVRAGDLPSATPATLLLDTICGAALSHVLTCPQSERDRLHLTAGRYADAVVAFVMSGLSPA